MDAREARVIAQLEESASLKRRVAEECSNSILEFAAVITRAVKAGNKLLICGNGGSAADAQHFAAEMLGRLNRERPSIPAIALTTDTSILTAVGNDYGVEHIFVRQVEGLGRKGDVIMGISTSGTSRNVGNALNKGKMLGMIPLALLGGDGGTIGRDCENSLIVPSTDTQRIQECHITIIHILCDLIERALYFE